MTLSQLSPEYRASALLLRARIHELNDCMARVDNDWECALLADRIRILTAMWSQMRDLAVLTEHYYERGYRRNAKYTL